MHIHVYDNEIEIFGLLFSDVKFQEHHDFEFISDK